jgi:hypothetical protein
MDPKLFVRLAKKIDEFIKETADEDLKFFFGSKTPAIIPEAAASVFDGMALECHLSDEVGSDFKAKYETPKMIPVEDTAPEVVV